MIEAKAKNELPACPVETTLTLIGDKWKVLILRDLMPGTKRFGELKKSVGNVSQKVLTAQLRAMEANGLVHREVYAEVPPRVEYSLTELGKSLKPILIPCGLGARSIKAVSRPDNPSADNTKATGIMIHRTKSFRSRFRGASGNNFGNLRNPHKHWGLGSQISELIVKR